MDKSHEVGCKPDVQSSTEVKEQRIKELRSAFLKGKLSVDSQQLASKVIAFEKAVDDAFSNASK